MALKFVAVLCVSVVMAQSAYGQALNTGIGSGFGCNNGYSGSGLIGNSLGGNLGFAGNTAYGAGNLLGAGGISNAGSPSFSVVSGSSLNPSGISVISNTEIAGEIGVNGALPYASAVAVEGTVPAGGDSSVNYGCGSNVALNSAGNGYGSGLAGNGFAGGVNSGFGNAGLAGVGSRFGGAPCAN